MVLSTELVGLRAEHELLLLCSRTRLAPQAVARVKELVRQQLDWDYLFKFGRKHGLLPLFYVQLTEVAIDQTPPQELARLKQHYQENAARNSVLRNELSRILRALAAAGIEAIPYKGPALAAYAYGNPAYRRFMDLDVMVRKVDVPHAASVLIEAGYVAGKDWTDTQQDLLLRTQHNLQFTGEEGRLVVELHWEVASGLFARSVQAEALWARLVPMTLDNLVLKTLAPEDLLLALCVHGSKHLWERLSWVCDVAEVLRSHSDINWDVVWERAGRGENRRMLALGLSLTHRLFDTPLPQAIQAKLVGDGSVNLLVADTCKRVFNRGEEELISVSENFRFNLRLRDSWWARMRYFRLILRPTDADVSSVSLPGGLGFGYYLLRPFRFLRQKR